MATPLPIAKGSIFSRRMGVGPTNSELVVNDAGEVIHKIGNPTVPVPALYPSLYGPYSSLPNTGLTPATQNADGFVLLNNWLSTYLIDSPPALNITGSNVDTQRIQITFTLPAQKRLAFSQTAVPYIQTVKADVVASALNSNKDWADASAFTVTLETVVGNAFASVTTLNMWVDAGTSALVSTAYNRYGSIASTVLYDIRLYTQNQSDSPVKSVAVLGLATLPVGTPIAPTGLAAANVTASSLDASWTKPADHDTNTTGNQITPFIARYKVSKVASSSLRNGGPLADTADLFTALTTGSNSLTTLSLSALNPGTTYSLTVAALNAINPAYGPASSPAVTVLTNYPTAPSYLAPADITSLLNVNTLRGPYSTSGGYSLDGTTAANPLLTTAVITDSNLRTTLMPARRTNATIGATGTVGALVAFGGPTSTFTTAGNTASFSAQGLGTTSPDGAVTNGCATVSYSGDADAFAAGAANQQGFYKTILAYAAGASVATNFPAAAGQYSLQLQYTPVGGSATQSTQVTFYVDNATTATALNNVGITSESATAVTQISGVPTFTSAAVFKTQLNQTEIAHYFLRNDKKHVDLVVKTSTGTALSATVTINKALIDGSAHKYFVAPATNKYTTSTTVSNGGAVLAATSTPAEIQFNTVSVPLTTATNVFDEAVVLQATPYSVFSNSGATPVSGAYFSTTSGAALQLRVDTASVLADRSAASNAALATGQHMSSGSGQYTTTGYTTAFNHSQDITALEELQLVNAQYSSVSYNSRVGYKNYGLYYFSGAFAKPDYSSISADTNWRYVTFKYTGRITGTNTFTKVRLAVVHSGLTVNLTTTNAANHRFQIKVDGTPNNNTSWMSAADPVSALGIGTGGNGTACIDTTFSTASQRDCVIRAGTPSSAVFYVRVGIQNNVAASVTSVTLTPVVNFT